MGVYLISTSKAEHLAKRIRDRIKDLEVIFPDLSRDGKGYGMILAKIFCFYHLILEEKDELKFQGLKRKG